MHKSSKNAARNVEAEMFKLYQERGAMTDTDLIRAGFSQEEIAIHAPRVSARIRDETTAIAA